jgi:DNA-binding IscR family transcriptional regulator
MIREIARILGISESFLRRVIAELERAGIVKTYK